VWLLVLWAACAWLVLLFVEASVCFLCVVVVDDEVLCDQHAADNVLAITQAATLLPPNAPFTANSCTPPDFQCKPKQTDCGGILPY
jgi:hypothetical protein